MIYITQIIEFLDVKLSIIFSDYPFNLCEISHDKLPFVFDILIIFLWLGWLED